VCTGFVSEYSVAASDYENLLMVDALVKWAVANPGTRVIQKLHPGEERTHYEEARAALGWPEHGLTMERERPLWDVLDEADVLVAAYSTTVLEAAVLGTPAIVVDAIAGRHLVELERLPGVSMAFSVEELGCRLNEHRARRGEHAPRDTAADAVIQDYLHVLDGGATARVCDLVSALPAGSTP
jgi:CDP-glycerol glycerophosphotransferase (TagB/SpsB family)